MIADQLIGRIRRRVTLGWCLLLGDLIGTAYLPEGLLTALLTVALGWVICRWLYVGIARDIRSAFADPGRRPVA